MATKSTNVTARVQPEIKQQAEVVLEKIGLPVSDVSYRQIIMTGAEFNTMMEKGYYQAKRGEGISVDEAFEKIRKGM